MVVLFLSVQAEEGSQVEMVLRFQCKDLTWTWVYIQAMKCPDSQGFTCQNFIIGLVSRAKMLRLTECGCYYY